MPMFDINLLTVRALTLVLFGQETHTRTRTLKPHFALARNLKRKGQDCRPMTPSLDIPAKTLIFANTSMRTSNFTFNFPLLELRSFENIHACKGGKCNKYPKKTLNKIGYVQLRTIDIPLHIIGNF